MEQKDEQSLSDSYRILSDAKDVYRSPEGSGIHPREASRHHVDQCGRVLEKALTESKISMKDIDFIAYSAGPGLGPCLRVGAVVARSLGSYYNKPVVPTNHAIGHIELGKFLCGLSNPLALLVSGGHTALTAQVSRDWKIFGETLDLTLGQLVDQFGRFLGLSSPAGARIEALAAQVESDTNSQETLLSLPYSIKGNDVSYSGLLSAAKEAAATSTKEDLCFALQEVAFSILTEATERALAFTGRDELLVVGGVAANQRLRIMLATMCTARGVRSGIVPKQFAGDCGSQIALTGFTFYKRYGPSKISNAFIRQSWRLDRVVL